VLQEPHLLFNNLYIATGSVVVEGPREFDSNACLPNFSLEQTVKITATVISIHSYSPDEIQQIVLRDSDVNMALPKI